MPYNDPNKRIAQLMANHPNFLKLGEKSLKRLAKKLRKETKKKK